MLCGTDGIPWNIPNYFPHSSWMLEISKNILWNTISPTEHCYDHYYFSFIYNKKVTATQPNERGWCHLSSHGAWWGFILGNEGREPTVGYKWLTGLRLRNNWLEFNTWENLPIILEEYDEYTSNW